MVHHLVRVLEAYSRSRDDPRFPQLALKSGQYDVLREYTTHTISIRKAYKKTKCNVFLICYKIRDSYKKKIISKQCKELSKSHWFDIEQISLKNKLKIIIFLYVINITYLL